MLLNNGTWYGWLRPVAGPLRGLGLLANSRAAIFRDNTLQFGGRVSIPNGYQSAYRAVVPTVKETEYIAVRMLGAGDASFTAQGVGSLGVTLQGEGSTVFNSQKGGTLFVSMTGEGSLTAAARGIGSLSVAMDAGARPSAYDIAQEVLQTQAATVNAPGTIGNKINSAGSAANPWAEVIESGYTAAEILRLLAAHAAGAATGLDGSTIAFKSLDGTKDRISGTITGGAREIDALDAS